MSIVNVIAQKVNLAYMFLSTSSTGANPLSNINVNEIMNTADTAAQGNQGIKDIVGKTDMLTGGAFQIVRNVVVMLLIIGFMIGIAIFAFSNSQNRNEAKTGLIVKVLAVVLFFSIAGFVAFTQGLKIFG